MGSKPTGGSMNGLTAANVDGLIDAIQKTHANCMALEKREAARALADVLFVIKQLREENTTHPSRPDRVGDECWYEFISHEYVDGKLTRPSQWKRGILRSWIYSNEHCIAIVEDFENHNIETAASLTFSTEAPT
jgi:hypothetical protein